jgi:hypothetical protein
MADYIDTPFSHHEWDPSKGDFYSSSVFADDQYHEKKLSRRKYLISGLISLHIILLFSVVIFFS